MCCRVISELSVDLNGGEGRSSMHKEPLKLVLCLQLTWMAREEVGRVGHRDSISVLPAVN